MRKSPNRPFRRLIGYPQKLATPRCDMSLIGRLSAERYLSAFRVFFYTVGLVSSLLCPRLSFAHPMGNFTINHYSGIRINEGYVEIQYLIDMAEIPTFQEIQRTSIVPREGDPGAASYIAG